MTYGQQPPNYHSFMKNRIEAAQIAADREYYDLINGRPQPMPQQEPSTNKNAYSVVVANETEATNYPVNQSLDDMFFICGDNIYLKTYDLGKGKWNDIQKYTIDNKQEKTDDIAELKQFMVTELARLEKKIKPSSNTKAQKAVAKVIDEVTGDDDIEYEDVIVKKPVRRK